MNKRFFVAISWALLAGVVSLASCSQSEPRGSSLTFYGRVCLGPDKTNQDLILDFIVQGPDIYLDRNQDHLAQPEEKLQSAELPLFEDSAAGVKYHLRELRLTKGAELVSKDLPQCLAMTVTISGKVNYEQIGQIFMTTEPQSPQWIHFHGNNHLIWGDPDAQLTAKEEIQLKVFFGTNAVGEGKDLGTPKILEADKSVRWEDLTESDRFTTIMPDKNSFYPELMIEYPTAGEPVVERIPLNEFC